MVELDKYVEFSTFWRLLVTFQYSFQIIRTEAIFENYNWQPFQKYLINTEAAQVLN